jgi:hypothetical protein
MTKNPGKIISFDEMIGKPKDLHPCPCNPACTCEMTEPCLGCETYGEWLSRREE